MIVSTLSTVLAPLAQLANHEFQVGPLLVPFALLLVVVAVVATIGVGNRLARGAGVEVEPAVWRALLAAAVTARLGFVVENLSLYLAAPLTILDVRDGGWNPVAGLLGAWLYAIVVVPRRNAALVRPLRGALATGSTLLVIGLAPAALVPPPGPALPRDLTLAALDGATVQLGRFAGKPTVVNLWATWCGPCAREMPVLHAAQAARQDVHFVFINQGEDAATVTRWLDARGLALRNVLIDQRRQASAVFALKGYPTTLFFAADGTLVSRRVGEVSAATLAERLQALSR